MLLRSVEIAGFKSFAKRTKIDFGTDFCAIVGPNGSGKSNIADAVRWVLGEQKTKLLRTQKSEDVIFHGSDGRARASMAEVTLVLDNQSGQLPVDFAEIEITRQAYRSGESNYLLNGKRTTVAYLQELLAKAGFGIGSYTVIGQGMIDRLILASGQERKLLFEQASGIKQFEIKLAQTQAKLKGAQENVDKLDQQVNLLSPEQVQLQKQLEVLDQKASLQKQLGIARGTYLFTQKNQLKKDFEGIHVQSGELQENLRLNKLATQQLEKKQAQMQKLQATASKKTLVLRVELEKLERQRDEVIAESSRLSAELGTSDHESFEKHQSPGVIKKKLCKVDQQIKQAASQVKALDKIIAGYEAQIQRLDKKLQEKTHLLNDVHQKLAKSQKKEYLNHAIGLLDLLQKSLSKPGKEAESKVIFYKLHHMLVRARDDNSGELALQVGRLQTGISHILADREEVVEKQTGQVIRLRSLELDVLNFSDVQKNLKKQLKQIDVSTSAEASSHVKAKHTLHKLEDRKSILDTKLGELRNELYTQTDANENNKMQKEAIEHEKLTNQQVLLQAQLQQVGKQKAELEEHKRALQTQQKLWFGPRVPPEPKQPSKSVTLEAIQKLETEVSLFDEINPQVQARLEKVTDELEFVKQQKQDVVTAVENLETATKEILIKMQSVFVKNFSLINTGFQRYFKDLFGGGSASLSLVKEDDDNFGVEIIVQLPHKKTQALASLSGGEKALASVALLSGILATNPSPFVVLDEVDAALDEQNTQRFAQILRQLAKKSQILVITHNHDTMAQSDELIGVTTSNQGDSQILRVALSEAFELPEAK